MISVKIITAALLVATGLAAPGTVKNSEVIDSVRVAVT